MKKIITAAAIAAMAASFATAEVKVGVNYRTGIWALQHELDSGKPTYVFNNDTKTTPFSKTGSGRSTSDALTFKGSAEYGGLELEIDPTQSGGSKSLSLEKYNGWINFGNFMIKSGTWDSRAVGRVNGDEGNHEGKYWGEINKPGLAVAGGTAGNGVDISQQSGAFGKNKQQTTMVQYKNKDLGLEARFGYTDNDGTKKTFAGSDDGKEWDDWVSSNESWNGEVGYTIDGVGRILASTKLSHKDYAAALFFEPKLANLSALTSLVGFTYETATGVAHGKGLNSDMTENATTMAIDLRARYNLSDFVEGLSVTFMYNWTFGNIASDHIATDAFGKEYFKNYKNYYTYYDDADKPGFYATWAMLNVTYNLNDTFTPFLSLGWSNASTVGAPGAVAAFDEKLTYSLRTYAGVEIYNTKNANLITGVLWDVNNMNDEKNVVKDFSIPVLLRVKF